jgi:hypothetical protein
MLLEVILSVLIIGSFLVMVVRSYAVSLRAGKVAAGLSRSCSLLEGEIFNLDVKGFREGLKEKNTRDFFKDEPGYQWSIAVNPMDKPEKINKVVLNMLWKEHVIGISTYLKLKEG